MQQHNICCMHFRSVWRGMPDSVRHTSTSLVTVSFPARTSLRPVIAVHSSEQTEVNTFLVSGVTKE